MKAASKTAISDATSAIYKSICTENGLHGECMLDPAVCAPASLTEAQNAIDALEITLATLDACMKARIVQARKRRNDFLPINQLPVEMVVEIFHNVLDSDALCPPTNIPYLTRLKTLASVCSAWRRLVSDTPSLWAVLESTCPPAFLPTVIRKAKGSPLNIRCGPMGGYSGIYLENSNTFLRSIIPLASKWATLYLNPPAFNQPPIHQVLEENMPILRKVWCKGDGTFVAKPFGRPTPRLKELRLHNMSVYWSFVELKDLSALVLVDSGTPSISRLLAILQRSPQLELLELRDSKADATDAPSATPSIILPHLKDLTLSNINQQAISSILRSIHVQRFSTLVIAPDPILRDPDTPFLDLNLDLEHLVPAMQSAITGGKAFDLLIGLNSLAILVKRDTNEPSFKFSANLNGPPHLQSHFLWLQSNIDFNAGYASGIREASVSFGLGTSLESSVHFQILEWIPNITELTTWTYNGASELINYLTERICHGNKVEWRCPRLRRVRFSGYPTALEDVLEFARRRYGDRPKGNVSEEKGEIIIHWPETLEYMDVEGVEDMTSETVEELREITGCAEIVGFYGDSEPASPEEWYDEGYDNSDEDSLGSMDLHDIFSLVGQ
ncbi:hypothetical protein M407DRAFT_30374 [Tulasnella calospora MUT 4182]|uniref:F-box domain-containing protein n=1 Tax=Tulasnella calospora MUT 4182 TaxID=1051891 RepID=A0A0C3PXV4_9AGAM|nr:hypothetical protein M407DRAFT_30374 [Tulasnella calospora MUT 4182]